MARQRDLFEILGEHEVGLNKVQRALSRLGQFLMKAGDTMTGILRFENSFGDFGGNIQADPTSGDNRLVLTAEGGDAYIQVIGSSDAVPDALYFHAGDGAGGSSIMLNMNNDTLTLRKPMVPVQNNVVDLGTAALTYKDVFAYSYKDETGAFNSFVKTDRTYTSSYVVTTTPAVTTACTIVIPAHWNTYDVELFYTCYLSDSSGGSGASTVFTGDWRKGSTSIGYWTLLEFDNSNLHDNHNFATNAFQEGLTATGTQTWNLYTSRVGAPTINLFRGIGIARAIRTS